MEQLRERHAHPGVFMDEVAEERMLIHEPGDLADVLFAILHRRLAAPGPGLELDIEAAAIACLVGICAGSLIPPHGPIPREGRGDEFGDGCARLEDLSLVEQLFIGHVAVAAQLRALRVAEGGREPRCSGHGRGGMG